MTQPEASTEPAPTTAPNAENVPIQAGQPPSKPPEPEQPQWR